MRIIEVENKLKEIFPILQRDYHVKEIGYFGSYVRNEQTNESDIDILVNFNISPGWEFFDLHEYLENKLGAKVDLVTSNALKRQLKDKILSQVKYIA